MKSYPQLTVVAALLITKYGSEAELTRGGTSLGSVQAVKKSQKTKLDEPLVDGTRLNLFVTAAIPLQTGDFIGAPFNCNIVEVGPISPNGVDVLVYDIGAVA